MALNVFEILALHNNLFFDPITSGSNSRGGGAWASEFPLVADNINGQLARYTRIAGVWQSANISNTSTDHNSFAQNNGNVSGATPWRTFGTYFVRGTYFTTPADGTSNYRSGYIGSFVGGYGGGAVTSNDEENSYGHDANGSSVDFEPIYGHGTVSWGAGQPSSFSTMFRDGTSLPSDGTAVVTKSASAQTWTRTLYMPPVYYTLWNANVGGVARTLGSGDVGFYVEERPSIQVAGTGSSSPFSSEGSVINSSFNSGTPSNSGSNTAPNAPTTPAVTQPANTLYPYEYFNVSGARKLNTRSMSLLWARIFDNGPTAYGWRYEEDGTDADGSLISVNTQTEYLWQRGSGQVQSPPISTAQEQRVRNAAYFTINEEYYGFVMDTKCMIFSNKSSMLPLIFFDLVDTWGTTNPRIAGVAITGTSGSNKIYLLSENGALAVYDFTQTNGSLTLLTGPGSPSANEGYSSLAVSSDGLTLYALYGTWIQDHRQTSTGVGSPRVAVLPYTIGTDTWGSLDVSPLTGRINGRHLREMMALRDGRMAIVCEDVTVVGSDTQNTLTNLGSSNNCAWQVMFFDPSATSKWNTSIIRDGSSAGGSAPLRSGTITTLLLNSTTLTVTTSNTFTIGDYVTFNGITAAGYLFLNGLTVLITGHVGGGPTYTGFTATIAATISGNVATSGVIAAGIATRGMQYGSNVTDYWFRNVNAHMHDIAPNKLLVQGNWACGGLWVLALNAAGGAGPTTATTANVSQGTPTSIIHTDIAPYNTVAAPHYAGSNPVDIRHAVDGNATTGDRTFFWFNDRAPTSASLSTASSSTLMRMYYVPPSFAWSGSYTTAMQYLEKNAMDSAGYLSTWGKPLVAGGSADYWTVGDLITHNGGGQPESPSCSWTLITQVRDNYCHFVKIASGSFSDGGPTSTFATVYGRRVSQTLAYLPTYWKWTGAAWVLADSSSDAKNNPRTLAAYTPGADVTMPYGLILNYGTSSPSSYGANEFYTFCLCYGNTKFLRNARFPWAMFAGQTFLQTDTRTMSSQRAMAMHLVDTDLMTVTTPTVPFDPSSSSVSVTTSVLDWTSLATWPKLNVSNQPYNGPLQMVLAVTGNPDPTTAVIPPNPATLVNGAGGNPNTWTVGGNTYVLTATSVSTSYAVAGAVYGSPNVYWKANAGPTQNLTIDLGAANAQTVRSYSFRPYFDSSNTTNACPIAFQLQGSNNGTFTDNSGGPFIIDDRTGGSAIPVGNVRRGMAFNCGGAIASHRYYRLNITTVGSGSTPPALGMFQLYTAVLASTVSFSDLGFFNYGDNMVSGEGNYIRNNQYARGLTFEVSTDGGSTYTPITPLWRAHQGYAFCFTRQTGVNRIRITCQSGYNWGTGSNITNNVTNNAFGPVYLFDWMTGAGSTALDTARLGSSGASNGTAPRGSWDDNCLGIAVDAVTLSIDGGSPNQLSPTLLLTNPYGGALTGIVEQYTALQIWDFYPVVSLGYKVHPFWGFVLFDGAGQNGALSTTFDGVQTGTSLAITYHWGRRI